jgi:hypothetical protein
MKKKFVIASALIIGCLASCTQNKGEINMWGYSLLNLNKHAGHNSTNVEVYITSHEAYNIGDTVIVTQCITVSDQEYIDAMNIECRNSDEIISSKSNYSCIMDTVGNQVKILQAYRMVISGKKHF